MKSIGKIVKIIIVSIIVILIATILSFELWFFEYYHLPPVSFVKVESTRTKLINGIESYQSIDDFKSYLGHNSLQWKVDEDGKPTPKGRPPFNIYEITIDNYSHLGFGGELTVVFFNNRLLEARFFPSDVKNYITALEKDGIRFDNNQEAKLSPYTLVLIATDYKERQYVGWSDTRLEKEFDLWIKRYS